MLASLLGKLRRAIQAPPGQRISARRRSRAWGSRGSTRQKSTASPGRIASGRRGPPRQLGPPPGGRKASERPSPAPNKPASFPISGNEGVEGGAWGSLTTNHSCLPNEARMVFQLEALPAEGAPPRVSTSARATLSRVNSTALQKAVGSTSGKRFLAFALFATKGLRKPSTRGRARRLGIGVTSPAQSTARRGASTETEREGAATLAPRRGSSTRP